MVAKKKPAARKRKNDKFEQKHGKTTRTKFAKDKRDVRVAKKTAALKKIKKVAAK